MMYGIIYNLLLFPPSFQPPSYWLAAVAPPHKKSFWKFYQFYPLFFSKTILTPYIKESSIIISDENNHTFQLIMYFLAKHISTNSTSKCLALDPEYPISNDEICFISSSFNLKSKNIYIFF